MLKPSAMVSPASSPNSESIGAVPGHRIAQQRSAGFKTGIVSVLEGCRIVVDAGFERWVGARRQQQADGIDATDGDCIVKRCPVVYAPHVGVCAPIDQDSDDFQSVSPVGGQCRDDCRKTAVVVIVRVRARIQ